MSGRDIDADYARLHGIEDEGKPKKSKLDPEECPRCSDKVDPNASFCQNCGQALTREAFEEIEEAEEEAVRKLAELQDKDVMEDCKAYLHLHPFKKNAVVRNMTGKKGTTVKR